MSFRLPNADGYIFDFNGTLYWDSKENREAWSAIFSMVRGSAITDEEFSLLNGRTDDETVLYLRPDDSFPEREKIAMDKERIYKELCLEHRLTLSPGSEELLQALKERNSRIRRQRFQKWRLPLFFLSFREKV